MRVGQRVQALYEGKFYEASVQSASSRSVGVQFLGYGNTATLKPSEVREAPALPRGWEESTDPSSGYPFWVHAVTGESQWERPKAPPPAVSAPRGAAPGPAAPRPTPKPAAPQAAPRLYAVGGSRRRVGGGMVVNNNNAGQELQPYSATPASSSSSLQAAGMRALSTSTTGTTGSSRGNNNIYTSGRTMSAAERAIRDAAAAPGAFSMSVDGARVPNNNAFTSGRGGRSMATPGAFGMPMKLSRRGQLRAMAGDGCGCGVAGC